MKRKSNTEFIAWHREETIKDHRRDPIPLCGGVVYTLEESLRRLEEAEKQIHFLKMEVAHRGSVYAAADEWPDLDDLELPVNLSTLQQGDASSTVCEKDQEVKPSANDCDKIEPCGCCGTTVDDDKDRGDATESVRGKYKFMTPTNEEE